MLHLLSLPMVAIVTTGRTGSDFLQSLLDSHPQISTFNGHFAVYTEFFEKSVTINDEQSRVCDVADEFIGKYIYKLVSRYDIQEAKDELGANFDESIVIDTDDFKKHMILLMKGHQINSHNILISIYGAYSLCINQDILKIKLILHHPHLAFEFEKFYKDFPSTKIIFTSRDPRANFCSHVEHFKKYYPSHDNQRHVFNCLKMALEDSELADVYGLEYTATRLEDLPRKEIMMKIAEWLGVDYLELMLRSTWVGLDWHGDRISNKIFESTGWTKNRANNGWDKRLGSIEKYVLNYILNSRLHHYQYKVKNFGVIDSIVIAILILFPFKYERAFFKPSYFKDRIVNRRGMQLFFIPIYYLKRVAICYKYYFRTLRKHEFKRNWICSNL
jgi:hypothetical protein